jgi:hypothetical protein
VVEASAGVSFVDAICAPAVTFGGERSRCSEVVVQWRRWRLPVTGCAPLGSGSGNIGGECRLRMNLVPRASRPPPLYIAQCDGVHQPCRVGRPRSGHENKAQKVVRPNGGRSKPNILPLDLSSFSSFFNFILKTFIHIFLASILFHYRLVH